MDIPPHFDMVSKIGNNRFVGNSRDFFRIIQSLLLGVTSLGNLKI